MEEKAKKTPNPLMMLNIIHRLKRKKSKKPFQMSPAKTVLRRQHLEISNFFKEKSHSVSRKIKLSQTSSVNNIHKKKLGNLFNLDSKVYIDSIAHSKENNILPKIRTLVAFGNKIKQTRYGQKRKKKKINITMNKPKLAKQKSKVNYELIDYRSKNRETQRKHSIITSNYPKFLTQMYKESKVDFNKYPIENKAFTEIHNYKDEFLVFGGFGISYSEELIVYSKKYDRIFTKKHRLNSRVKFASLGISQLFLVHGGEVSYNYQNNKVLNDIFCVDVVKMQIRPFVCVNNDFPFRRSHIMFLIGEHLIFEGGYSFHNYKETELYSFSLLTNKLKKVKEVCPEWRGHHRCATVGQNFDTLGFGEMVQGSLQTIGPVDSKRKNNLTKKDSLMMDCEIYKEQRVFVFGGLNEEGKTSDLLYSYHYSKSDELILTYPNTKGISPIGRYDHQMKYIKELNSVIVVGGKNREFSGVELILSDLWLLEVTKLYWIRVDLKIQGRYGFGMMVNEGDLLIFGGYSEENLTNGYVKKIEIDKKLIDKYVGFFSVK